MEKETHMKLKPLVNATCKLGLKGCYDDGRCHALGNCENKIVTNADRIRAMSDEELEKCIIQSGFCPASVQKESCYHSDDDSECSECIKKWLQSEVQ